ncbi:MAG: hypothetical protein ACO1TE_28270 [Prosthecobacter sp.]
MKRVLTRLLFPAVALVGLSLSSCVDPYLAGVGPGYYRTGPSYYGPSRSYYSSRYSPSYGRSYYGSPYRSYSSVYSPIGLGLGTTFGSPFYGSSFYGGRSSYYGGRSPYYNSNQRSEYVRATRGYYPNDPDDRNNPRHPNYIGRAPSRRGWR